MNILVSLPLKVYHVRVHTSDQGYCRNRALDKREYLVIIRDNFVNSA